MAKFLVTYKVEKVHYQTSEVEEDDVMLALDNARNRAKLLSDGQPSNDLEKVTFSLVSIKQLNGE